MTKYCKVGTDENLIQWDQENEETGSCPGLVKKIKFDKPEKEYFRDGPNIK